MRVALRALLCGSEQRAHATSSAVLLQVRNGEPDSTPDEIMRMVRQQAAPSHRLILFLQQSSVEWASSLWLHVVQEVDPTFRWDCAPLALAKQHGTCSTQPAAARKLSFQVPWQLADAFPPARHLPISAPLNAPASIFVQPHRHGCQVRLLSALACVLSALAWPPAQLWHASRPATPRL
jgi:hypothetical protein